MSQRFQPRLLIALLTRALALLMGCSQGFAAQTADASGLPSATRPNRGPDLAAELFEGGLIPRISIEISEADVAILAAYRWRGPWGGQDDGEDKKRPAVQVTVREGLQIYTNVSLHLKGSAGSFRPIFSKPGLTLNFSKHVKGQRFHGLERLSLNNSVQDPTYLSEQICRELYAEAGVPVARATHAVVTLNGRPLGLYVLLEAVNKQFLRRAFGNDNGHLYDGGFVRDVTDGIELASGKNPDDRSDVDRLGAALTEAPPEKRLAELEKVLDVDRFLTVLAMDVILCNTDGYAMNRNNYRIYHDPSNDRLVFMPHGLDQMFGTFRSDPTLPIFPRAEGRVARVLWQSAEGRRRYRARLAELVERLYHPEAITNRVQQMANQIRPLLVHRTSGRATQFDRQLTALKSRIVARGESLREQLSAPSPTLAFNTEGTAQLDGWKPALDFGQSQLESMNDPTGEPLLHLAAEHGSAVGAWTTRVVLEPGRYRFEGQARCQGVVPEPGDRRGGVALRTASKRATQKLTGDADWSAVALEFEVLEGTGEVDLRCELRAVRGQAWFQRRSLQLKRL